MNTTKTIKNSSVHRSLCARLWTSLSVAAICALGSTTAQAQEVIIDAPSLSPGYPALVQALDPIIEPFLQNNDLPGLQVAVSKDGRLVFSKAYGMANATTQQPMETTHRNRIGSVSKIVNALTVLKVAESLNPNLELLDKPIYGPWGLLNSSEPEYAQLIDDQIRGRQRKTPVVGTIIVPGTDRTYTYYDDDMQTYSIGRTHDLDYFDEGLTYDLPPDQSVRDIRGMAASPEGFVYTWYSDGSLSKGTVDNLNFYANEYVDASEDGVAGVDYPSGQRADFLVGVGIAKSSGKAYAWFEDGTRAYGTPMDLNENVGTYSTPNGEASYDLRSLAIASNDRVYAFYGDNKASSGTSLDLDAYRPLYKTSLASNISAQPWELWYGTMTLRHLLSHTAGFRKNSSATGGAMMFHPNEDPSVAARDLGLRNMHRYALSARELIYEVGTARVYSNHGAALAGWVLEETLNLPWKVIADLLILDPLGLDMKRAWDPLDSGDAWPHVLDDNDDPIACFASCQVDIDFSDQSGYLTGSAEDLVRLMLATDQDPMHDDVLLPATLTEMETTLIAGSRMGWGGNASVLTHNGAVNGGSSTIAKYMSGAREGITVAVVANIDADGLGGLRNEVATATEGVAIPLSYDLY